jgi:hypothetical protein
MTERLSKLLSVKSIMTLVLTAVFAYLAIIGSVTADQFLTVFSMIVAFYFGTQHEKKAAATEAATLMEGVAVVEGADRHD